METHATYPTTHVDEMRNVMPSSTRQCASALQAGQGILTNNASNVGSEGLRPHTFPMLYVLLILDDCVKNSDCPLSLACFDHECVDPCQRIRCGQRAECKVENHFAYCVCPPGFQGNPVVSCSEVGCLEDDDCSQTEKCNYESQRCYQLCRGYTCAAGAECSAANHKEDCRCRPPLQGDGFSFCEEGMAYT